MAGAGISITSPAVRELCSSDQQPDGGTSPHHHSSPAIQRRGAVGGGPLTLSLHTATHWPQISDFTTNQLGKLGSLLYNYLVNDICFSRILIVSRYVG